MVDIFSLGNEIFLKSVNYANIERYQSTLPNNNEYFHKYLFGLLVQL